MNNNILYSNNFYKFENNQIKLIKNNLSDFKINFENLPPFLNLPSNKNLLQAWLETVKILDSDILYDYFFEKAKKFDILAALKKQFNLNLKQNNKNINFLENNSFVDNNDNLFIYFWYPQDLYKWSNNHYKANFKIANKKEIPILRGDAPPKANNFNYFTNGIKGSENLSLPPSLLKSLKILCYLNNKREFTFLLKIFTTYEIKSGDFENLNNENFFAFKISLSNEDIDEIEKVLIPQLKENLQKYAITSPTLSSNDFSFFKLIYAKSISKII